MIPPRPTEALFVAPNSPPPRPLSCPAPHPPHAFPPPPPPPGERLSDMLSRWRAAKAAGQVEPFVLFPQGTTCAVGSVCDFQPRVVELLRDGERVGVAFA
jgi:hypothetical protein